MSLNVTNIEWTHAFGPGTGRTWNPVVGCTHGCRYCFGPRICHVSREVFFTDPQPCKDVLQNVRRQVWANRPTIKPPCPRVNLCFICDPYQPIEAEQELTRKALTLLGEANVPLQVLTKAGPLAVRDFDLLARYRGHFGTSMVWTQDDSRQYWEPNAAPLAARIAAMQKAKDAGIPVWVSLEPVIDPGQALQLIRDLRGLVDYWRIGRLTGYTEADAPVVDWPRFCEGLAVELENGSETYHVKESLRQSWADAGVDLPLRNFEDNPCTGGGPW